MEFYSRSNSGMLLIYNESISVYIPTYEAFRKELKLTILTTQAMLRRFV